ncbi:MAG: inositol monophosphatase family protein [Reyranellaceae bacterium]
MTFSIDELRRVGAILADAAAREIMPRFGRLGADQIRQKSSAFDVVTDADEAAEAAISRDLRAAFPGASIVGEEATEKEPGLLSALADAPLAFVVDPIDGTMNFRSHLPLFGVMAAAIARGRIVGGVIHDPVSHDWAYALAGGGAWLESATGERQPLKVAPSVPPAQMQGIVGTNYLPPPLRARVNGNLARLGNTAWLRCAAHEYRLAAAGHCHLLFYNKLMPWDHAAGWLLHREAGGYSAHFDGTPYLPTHTTGGLICAPDEASWQAARAALLDA